MLGVGVDGWNKNFTLVCLACQEVLNLLLLFQFSTLYNLVNVHKIPRIHQYA